MLKPVAVAKNNNAFILSNSFFRFVAPPMCVLGWFRLLYPAFVQGLVGGRLDFVHSLADEGF
jgi:hypothetical protein